MKIENFKNLKCHSCKKNLVLNAFDSGQYTDYEFDCKNSSCKYFNRTDEVKFFIRITIKNDDNNLNCGIICLNKPSVKAYGFYCKKNHSIYNGHYPNWIQLDNNTFFELLDQYLIDINFEKIKQKYETLKLFL